MSLSSAGLTSAAVAAAPKASASPAPLHQTTLQLCYCCRIDGLCLEPWHWARVLYVLDRTDGRPSTSCCVLMECSNFSHRDMQSRGPLSIGASYTSLLIWSSQAGSLSDKWRTSSQCPAFPHRWLAALLASSELPQWPLHQRCHLCPQLAQCCTQHPSDCRQHIPNGSRSNETHEGSWQSRPVTKVGRGFSVKDLVSSTECMCCSAAAEGTCPDCGTATSRLLSHLCRR